jgi:cation transport protein ChaC
MKRLCGKVPDVSGAWIFGYGSLVFRPGFQHTSARPAWLGGHRRRLWQGSPDHRGTPESPGRVATLVEDEGRVLGLAFHLEADQLAAALPGLDHREQAGYVRREVQLSLVGGGEIPALVYLATRDNPSWLGPASVGAIARHVARARGPSGTNAAYVLDLAAALVRLGLTSPQNSSEGETEEDEVLAVSRALHDELDLGAPPGGGSRLGRT